MKIEPKSRVFPGFFPRNSTDGKIHDIPERTANRDINELLDKKLIEKRGSGPGTYYALAIVRKSREFQ